ALNNIIQDGTYMKEYMSYDLMNAIGVTTPLYSFSNITVNGQEWGLYLAVESLSESFAKRTYGTDYGALYKVESDNMGGAKNGELPEEGKSMADSSMNSNSGGADLVYTDDELESYSDILNNPSYDVTDEEKTELIQAIKNLNEGVELEKYVDVDQTLRYIAANTVLVNLDSYFSNMKHNYYIYEENGQITPIPWDYNLSFAGFQSGDSTSAINFPIDTPVSGVELSERPLISKLFEKEEYLNQYHEYLQEIVSSYFDSGVFENRIHYLDGLIGEYVKNDPSAFYTYDEYQIAITELKEFGTLRALSIQGQLNHTIPSTTEGQQEDSSSLIDGSSVDISAMGTQGGDSMGEPSSRGTPGGQGENQLPEGMSPGGRGENELPEGMSPGGQGENQSPEGMSPGGQGVDRLPEGMSPEGQGENELPEGIPPGGQEEDLSNEGASDLQDAVPAGNMFKDQEMEFGQDSRKNMQFNVSSQKMSTEHVIYMVILVAVLAVMTLVAKFWKRRKVC
ncbi:MAG TPA: CotH kinase family protein, partial [Candidatus Merdenecus merdavium]|nr:CotH kinase family protein [Candidatus Merdenecus merdavium]